MTTIKINTNNDKKLKIIMRACKDKGYEYKLDLDNKDYIYPLIIEAPKEFLKEIEEIV